MLFVSRISNLCIVVRNARVRRIENEDGQFETVTIRPQLDVWFREKSLTESQRTIAVRQFTELNPKAPWGAAPYALGGVMGQEYGDMVMGDEQYTGFDPAFNLGMYNTTQHIDYAGQGLDPEDDDPAVVQARAELKALVEKRLLECSEFNKDYILLDSTLPKPWTNYPDTNVDTEAAVARILSVAHEIGVTVEQCLEYEIVKDPPSTVAIAAFKAHLAREDAAKRERDALGVQV